MYRNACIFLILLELVVFGTNSDATSTSTTNLEETTVDTESYSTHTSLSSSSTSMDLTDHTWITQNQSNTSVSKPPEEPSEGLSSGQIAGIAVGSIAGVAALGGGIYAGLKYTGKLGG